MGLLYGRAGRLTAKKRRFPARAVAHAETIAPLLVLLGLYKVRLLLRRASPSHVAAFV